MLIAVPFVVIITALVIIGLATTSQSQSSAWVSWLNQYGGIIGSTLALGVVAATDLARWATHKIGEHFQGIERLTVGWFGALFHYTDKVLSFAFLWPIELGKFAFWLLDVEIPRLIRALPTAAAHVIRQTIVRVQRVEHTIVKLPKLSRKQAQALIGAAVAAYVAPYLLPLRWLRAHFHALTAVLPHTLPIPFGRTIAQIKKRLRALERGNFVGAAAIAAVAFALTRLGLGWLRCSSLRRLGKRIGCGGFGLLEAFFADAFEVFIVTNLCTFIFLLQRAAEELRPEMLAFVSLENALINCHGNLRPPYLAHTTEDPPPAINPLPLAA